MECRLGEILEERGIKKIWLADKAKVSRNTVTALIKGSDPALSVADRVASALNLSIYDIWPELESFK